jgi:predicted transcriptional regulator
LKLLAKIFTPEQAELAAELLPTFETAEEIAARTGKNASDLRNQLKAMSRSGLIEAGKRREVGIQVAAVRGRNLRAANR